MKTHLSEDTKEFLAYFLSAVGVTMFLFFIDEGYYNFNWMMNIGNWIAFLIYVTGLLTGQFLSNSLILRKYKGEKKTLLTSIIGIPLGTAMIILLLG
jgi:hypothetical protein